MAGRIGNDLSKDLISERVLLGMTMEIDSIFDDFVKDRAISTQVVLEFLCMDGRAIPRVYGTRTALHAPTLEKGSELIPSPERGSELIEDPQKVTAESEVESTIVAGAEQQSPAMTSHTIAIGYDKERKVMIHSLVPPDTTTANAVLDSHGDTLRAKQRLSIARKGLAPKASLSRMRQLTETMSTKQLTLRYLVMLCVTFGSHILSAISPHFARFAESVPVALIASIATKGIRDITSDYELVLSDRLPYFKPYSTTPPLPHSVYLPIYVIYTWILVIRKSDDDETSQSA